MILRKVKRIADELERLTMFDIPIDRALDLMEASTENLEELLAINTMRECLLEADADIDNQFFPHPYFTVEDCMYSVEMSS